ncbi:MAG: sugar phosphorylase [Opitutaceae bacterium]|nr:sugar phosphorylase [Opitutaceae bacterium]
MRDALTEHLVALYGAGVAAEVRPRLEQRLAHWRARLPGPAGPARASPILTEHDALLITYADQVTAPGETPLHTLGDFARVHLSGVVSGLHLLPFYPWSSDDGFSVKDYHAVDPAYGTWDDIRRLGAGFDLMFDAVFNHLSVESPWFKRFLADDPAYRDFFVTVEGDPDLSRVVRPRALPLLTEFRTAAGPRRVWTTFSADQVDVNVRQPAVLLALLDALLHYVSHGARFIRLDAIAFLWKEIGTACLHLPGTHRVVQLMRSVLEDLAPRTLLITETNVPHADNLSYFGDGTNEAHLVYNFALPPLVLHTLATGDARRLTRWAQTLAPPSAQTAFFNFLASHDGIGVNPARGILTDAEIEALVARTVAHGGFISYKHLPDHSKVPYEMNISLFDALSDPAAAEPAETAVARFRCAHAIQLSLAGMPGLYFHSLFGSRGDRRGAETSGIPRRINREKLERAGLERELANPDSRRARVFAELRTLLQARSLSPAFHPAGAQEILAVDPRLFVVRRTSPDGHHRVLCVQNVAAAPVHTLLPRGAIAPGERTVRLIRTLCGARSAVVSGPDDVVVTLPPYAHAWVQAEAD